MINFRDTKSGDTFSEDGDGGIFYGTKSRVSTIRFEIVDTFLIDAHDITLNLNVSHHAFHDFNPFEQDEFAKGASLRLSIVQGKYSEGEVMDDLMDDLADFMHHHLGARKNRSKSSSKKKSAVRDTKSRRVINSPGKCSNTIGHSLVKAIWSSQLYNRIAFALR